MFSSRQLECGSVVPGEVESTEIIWTTGHRRPPFRTTHTLLACPQRAVCHSMRQHRATNDLLSELSGLLLDSANAGGKLIRFANLFNKPVPPSPLSRSFKTTNNTTFSLNFPPEIGSTS
ncbi:uncharacterized protein LOC120427956 [Culex pipiens pallens]|uniref:uncharacterized protein LOC120424573 n=1 Tax=Culex pipiens pallens TaxID=42434 RepID=UPI001952F865|nr:uncharacterized protein LOC120424573 [Culex pipiens pallens]XP_039448879.1 uncharacterized protein LOC120427956 [Culex pipiens pallens]